MKKAVNFTIELEDYEINNFDNWIRTQVNVISFKILPDTRELMENDPVFQRLVKQVKKSKEVRDNYINKKNHVRKN